MSFSDQSGSFSDDNAGHAADAPNVVLKGPRTVERVVETQSGFLVIVRRLESRLALSIKRHVGTPPASSIILTPDESIKLSHILFDHSGAGRSGSTALDSASPLISPLASPPPPIKKTRLSVRGQRVLVLAAVFSIAAVTIWAFAAFLHRATEPNPATALYVKEESVLLPDSQVDRFARTYVACLLDFDPNTYKESQVQAMSKMTAPLLERYWHETGFPLSQRRLRELPRRQTLMITQVIQKRLSAQEKEVDVFGDLTQAKSKITSPIHLQLRLLAAAGEIKVTDQKDLTAAPE